jgi:hypothetical protein
MNALSITARGTSYKQRNGGARAVGAELGMSRAPLPRFRASARVEHEPLAIWRARAYVHPARKDKKG